MQFTHEHREIQKTLKRFIDEQINHPNQVILANPILKTIWKKSRLSPRSPFDETRHADPPQLCRSLTQAGVCTQPRL